MGLNTKHTVAVLGMGLIGGSMALALKHQDPSCRIIGVEKNPEHARKAVQLGLADEIRELKDALALAGLVILAVPVDEASLLLPRVLDAAVDQVVMDVGSVKTGVVEISRLHPRRKNFVATHPMWGTEYSGPEAAVAGAFRGRAAVICNVAESSEKARQAVEALYQSLGMHLVYMDAMEHDLHVAYVSHISHITSFALANTVLEKEHEENTIFELASGGFESTVRLAKSNPDTWTSIFLQNRIHVLDVLDEHISQLKKFRDGIAGEDREGVRQLMLQANQVKKIIR